MKTLTQADMLLIQDMLKRCVHLNGFIAENVSSLFYGHDYCESIEAVTERLDTILKHIITELGGTVEGDGSHE